MSAFYVLEMPNTPNGTPFSKTTDGGTAAFVFTTAEKALEFAVAMQHSEWRVRELNCFDALDWLSGAIETNAVTAVLSDPNRVQEGHLEIPADVFRLLLEAECRKQSR